MKKTIIALVASATAMFAASCQKETTPVQEDFVPMTISAVAEGLGTPVKSSIEFKYDVTWTANDKIYVTDGNDKNDTFTITSESVGKTLGKFTQDGQTAFVSQETPSCDVEAYYPSSMVSGTTLTWPAIQTYSPENAQTVPMYSKKTITATGDQTFSFSSLGSVLQIVFNTTQEKNVTLKSIEIKDGEKTMSGAFTVDADGKAVITATDKAGITLDLGEGKALGKGANYFNIAVPAGNYQDLTLVFTATDGKKCTMTGGKVDIAHNTVGRLTITGEKFKSDIPDGALEGVFSVSATKQVRFSQGNLWADGDKALHFEANQYGFANSWNASHVSLFTWSSTIADAVGESNIGNNLFCDESHKVSVDGSEAIYYALSREEWLYLFDNRAMTNGGVKYSHNISYGGKIGVVLYPDGYSGSALTSGTDYTDANFPADCVFIPAAGHRLAFGVSRVGDSGTYWSSAAPNEDKACCVNFNIGGLGVGFEGRNYGCSVRLITDVK